MLLAWQGWITLGLFGSPEALTGPEPIVSGRHPLHLYHGWLGIRSLIERGTLCVYDPAFQAGYPRTPVFDGGSRPAELFLLLSGGEYCPASYKIGVFLCCLAAPLVFMLAARGFGLSAGGAVLAGLLGILVWWSLPARQLLEDGDVNLFLTLLAVASYGGLLIAFHERPGLLVWLGLVLSAGLGWWMMPLLFTCIILPLLLVYYLGTGIRHCLVWHLALAGSLLAGLAINSFWLMDWVDYLWMRLPVPSSDRLPIDKALLALLEPDAWGSLAERGLALGLLAAAVLGTCIWYGLGHRPAARIMLLAMIGVLGLSVASGTAEPLRQLGSRRLLFLALGFAVIPAAVTGQVLFAGLQDRLGWWKSSALLGGLAALGLTFAGADILELVGRSLRPIGFQVGLTPERRELVQLIDTHTTADARILWEDAPARSHSRWTALLPVLTQRSYLGGLDPEATVEHAYAAFVEQQLAGRPIQAWSDHDLEAFCRRYNIGWIVGWSAEVQKRLDDWCQQGKATRTVAVTDQSQQGWLYALQRDPSYILKGQAHLLTADRQRIALTNIVPDQGKIVLSLHYQTGMRVSPARVKIEPDPDPWDPIPFIRLIVPEPLTVLTLSWENP